MEAAIVHIPMVAIGVGLIAYFLLEAFETVILPRTISRSWRFTRWFYRTLWGRIWRPIGVRIPDFRVSDSFLGFFGPLSIIVLLHIWAMALILGYAVLQWGARTPIVVAEPNPGFGSYLYLSGVTFFTLGYGDVVPADAVGRAISVVETGMGFGFLAIVIGYLPVVYGAFSRREATVTLLDSRAGSPPSSLEMLRRHATMNAIEDMQRFLKDMERWISELLESHLSYPYLAFYRSQHDDQSWISALMVAMDTCAIVMTGLEGVPKWQAKLTFAMGRHALVDMCLVINAPPAEKYLSRLTPPDMQRITQTLAAAGIPFQDEATALDRLTELRRTYEPYSVSLARVYAFTLPPYVPTELADDWQRSAWERAEHF